MTEETPTYDVFLVIHPFRELVPELKILMRPVVHLESRHLVGADGYYAASIDAALINLRFHRDRADRIGHGCVVAMLGQLGLPVFAPEELSADEKECFFLEHLAAYSTYVQLYAAHEGDGLPLFDRVIDSLAEHAALVERALSEPTAGLRFLDDLDLDEPDEPTARGAGRYPVERTRRYPSEWQL